MEGVVEKHRVPEGVDRSEDEDRGRGVAEGRESRLPLRRAMRAKGVAIVTDGYWREKLRLREVVLKAGDYRMNIQTLNVRRI